MDILRPHDDYGTQILLFPLICGGSSIRKILKTGHLAHEYGAPLSAAFLRGRGAAPFRNSSNAAWDALEPVQKVKRLEVETLAEKYNGKIVFHGGIDTQGLLPFWKPEEVKREVRRFMDLLGKDGGYIP